MKKKIIFLFVDFNKIDFMEWGGTEIFFNWKGGGRPNKFEKHLWHVQSIWPLDGG